MNTAEWNEKFFAHRMEYRGSAPKAVAVVKEIWRTVEGSNFTEQVSDRGNFRKTTKERVLAGREGLLEMRAHPTLVAKVFPLTLETLF